MPTVVAGCEEVLLVNLLLTLITIGLSFWMDAKGNELTPKNYIESGWEFADPQSDITQYAKGRWGFLSNQATDNPRGNKP